MKKAIMVALAAACVAATMAPPAVSKQDNDTGRVTVVDKHFYAPGCNAVTCYPVGYELETSAGVLEVDEMVYSAVEPGDLLEVTNGRVIAWKTL